MKYSNCILIVIILILSIFCLPVLASPSSAKFAGEERMRETKLTWISHGKIFVLDNMSVVGDHVLWFYQKNNSTYYLLNESASNIALAVNEEVKESDRISFIQKSLPQLVTALYSSGRSRYLFKNYVEFYKDKPNNEVIYEKLKSLCDFSNPKINDNSWAWSFSVLTREGHIEHWQLRGEIKPFLIIAVEMQIVASGTEIRQLEEN